MFSFLGLKITKIPTKSYGSVVSNSLCLAKTHGDLMIQLNLRILNLP